MSDPFGVYTTIFSKVCCCMTVVFMFVAQFGFCTVESAPTQRKNHMHTLTVSIVTRSGFRQSIGFRTAGWILALGRLRLA